MAKNKRETFWAGVAIGKQRKEKEMNMHDRAKRARDTLAAIEQPGNMIPTSERTEAMIAVMYERLMGYAHRNGESEPPKIDGYFWVFTPDSEKPIIVYLYGNTSDPHLESLYGWGKMRYYGPIPEPERN